MSRCASADASRPGRARIAIALLALLVLPAAARAEPTVLRVKG
jgi:hypothetical protein